MNDNSNLSWNHPNLQNKKSNIEGTGLFTLGMIKAGEILSVFGGKIYTSQEILSLPKDSFIRNTASQVNGDFYVGPVNTEDCDISLFINHSCNPNAKIDHSILLIAIKDIMPNEEITIDYSHSHNKLLNFKCKCGQKNCRKFVKNSDFKDPKFRKLNKKYFAYWLR